MNALIFTKVTSCVSSLNDRIIYSKEESFMLLKHIKASLILLAAMIMVSAAVFTSTSMAQQQKVIIKGSTTVLPITMKAIDAFNKTNPNVAISVDGSGSGNGIKALLEGNCDIANSSREMKKEEFAKAKAANRKIKEIVVAYDMIVPVVHPSNTVKNLSMEQLKGIYDGSIKKWSEVGGENADIVVVSRDSSSGTYEFWHEAVLHKTNVRPDSLMQASNGAVVNAVANNRRAIGYIGFGYVNPRVKVLTVNNIVPTLANGKSGKYPISRKLYMYVDENKFSGNVKSFADFILGNQGQKLVSEAGFIPVK